MDGTQFDVIAQRLAAAGTRRRVVSSMLSGAALLTGIAVAGIDDADAKQGKGKGKGKGGNNKGKAKGKTKAYVCHKRDDGTFKLLRIGAPGLKGHGKHPDDVVCGEPDDCHPGKPTGCAEDGACLFESAADGTTCTTEDGDEGTCVGGVCTPPEAE